jgi:glycosyltransferase involved in cell wall biosynthesis
VFSDCWKKHLVDCFKIPSRNVSVFSHGIDNNKFNKISKSEAKKAIGIQEDGFMIFNMNRNSYRKLLDITIKAFVRFWKLTGCDEKVFLVLNCRKDIDTGYNFRDIVRIACMLENVDHTILMNNNIRFLSDNMCGNVSDECINTAINASDIGMNTCGGEGFGLCNAEGAYLGVPQIVTNTGGLSDIFRGFDNMLVDPKVFMSLPAGIDFHNGELAICDYKDFADKLLYYYNNRNILEADGVGIERCVRGKCDWDTLLDNFLRDIVSVVSNTK